MSFENWLEPNLEGMLTPTIVDLGSIKIGTLGEKRTSRSGNEYQMPKKLDHFIVTTKERDANGILCEDAKLMATLKSSQFCDLDGHVRRIPITVLSDDVDDFLRSNWVIYKGGTCYARSNGKKLIKYGDVKTGDIFDEPEEKDWEERFESHFKKHTTLDCVIAADGARWGGVYRFRTTSVISGDQLYGSLLHVKRMTNGILMGMPLMLVVRPIRVAPDGKPTIVYCVHVELYGDDLHTLQSKAIEASRFRRENKTEIAKMQGELRRVMNDPGEDEDEDVQSDVSSEFHPEHEDEPIDELENTKRVLNGLFSSRGLTDESSVDLFCEKYVGKTYAESTESVESIQEVIEKLNSMSSEELETLASEQS